MLDLPPEPRGAVPDERSEVGVPETAAAGLDGSPEVEIAEAGAPVPGGSPDVGMPEAASAVLDEAQRQAVDHGEGPCLVLAGPGSGKTRVIVERFLRLVREGAPADRLLVLTYTRKAAAEMRDRVERVHGPFEGDPPLLNYHSFAQRVLRRWGWRLGISPAFRIADDAERWLVVDAILAELRPTTLYNPLRAHDLVDPILDLIEKAKQELVSPEEYARWAEARLAGAAEGLERELLTRHRECSAVYRRLEATFLERAVLDHDDTILYAERLLRDHPDVREAVAGAIDHVMVDEYQDTNYAQARLVEALAGARGNLLVVADDDQSIYKFRGASLANLDRFARLYPQHRRVILDRNYRSHQEIVEASRAIIGAAPPGSRIEKHLVADRGTGGTVEVWRAADERGEVVEVAQECRRLLEAGADPTGIAWLFRRHDDMQAATRALQEAGVAYVVHGGRGFFQRREIKDLLAVLGAVHDPGDSQALLRCVNLPSFAVSNAGRLALGRAAHDRDLPLAAIIAGELPELSADDLGAARRLVEVVAELHAQAARDDVRDVFYAALERTEFLGVLDDAEPRLRGQVGANLNKFGELLEGFADWSDDRSLGLALRYLDILRNSRAADEIATVDSGEAGISLLTAHAAKGLEWPVVFLGRCTEERWPGKGGFPARLTLPDELVPEPAPEGEASRDEERRLFYVASTRARDRLVLVHARRYPHSYQDERPSPFLTSLEGVAGVGRRTIEGVRPPARRQVAVPSGAPMAEIRASVSDIAAFKDCARRYAYRAVYRLPVPASPQQWYGTLVHTVLQALAARRQSGADAGPDDAARLWADAWEASRGPKGAHAELRSLGESQLRRYAASPGWRDAEPLDVEQPFTLSVAAGEVTGRFDRIDAGPHGERVVVDYKTGAPRDEEALRRDLQVRAYAVALAREGGTDEATVELHWLQTAEVSRLRFDSRALGSFHFQVESSARELAQAHRLHEFPPRPSSWRCRRCEFRTVCDEGRDA
ncbi:MAG: ATP-dependent DNA helicase [Candidatus Dormibacteria bacterium]